MSDDRIAQALEVLSAKLGVTVQYLWGVLIAQARIDFFASLIQYAVIGVVVSLTVKLVRHCANPKTDEALWFAGAAAMLVSGVLCAAAFFSLPTFFASLLNPEYWALHEILSSVGRK